MTNQAKKAQNNQQSNQPRIFVDAQHYSNSIYRIIGGLPYFSSSLPFIPLTRGLIACTFSPPLMTVLAFVFIATRVQNVLPSSARVESCLHGLLLNTW